MSTEELSLEVRMHTKELAQLAADSLHREMLDKQLFRSCWNCDSMDKKTETCRFFQARPPLQVILFSCGKDWVGEIPF